MLSARPRLRKRKGNTYARRNCNDSGEWKGKGGKQMYLKESRLTRDWGIIIWGGGFFL